MDLRKQKPAPLSAECCPHDELALFKRGLVNRDCTRKSYGCPTSWCRASSYNDSCSSKHKKKIDVEPVTVTTKKVGSKNDYGTLTSTVSKDGGRTYELQTSKATIALELSEKHAYLVSSLK